MTSKMLKGTVDFSLEKAKLKVEGRHGWTVILGGSKLIMWYSRGKKIKKAIFIWLSINFLGLP